MMALAGTVSNRCFCNEKNRHACCIRDCEKRDPNCFPCHTSRGHEPCLVTGKTKTEMEAL